jgi:putative transposase
MIPLKKNERVYPTDMSDAQWQIIRPLLSPSPPIGTDRAVDMRKIVNGIFYLNRTGCQWRMLPKEYEHWNTTFGYYNRWRKDGTWQRIHDALREEVRRQDSREPSPSAAIIDSQSVKTTEKRGRAATMLARR